jgi:hypothetical protein
MCLRLGYTEEKTTEFVSEVKKPKNGKIHGLKERFFYLHSQ